MQLAYRLTMAAEKTVPISFRVSPSVKALLVAAAAAENRSLTNMLETLVLAHCERAGVQRSTAPVRARGVKR
jgi:uncharacterized protein (DUF1778 family)